MSASKQKTLFALDPGATNWRLYRTVYELEGRRARLLSEPVPSPLTSFTENRLPAALLLNSTGDGLESFGEAAELQLEDRTHRDRLRAYFKPAIGAHLLPEAMSHQTNYTHEGALACTSLLLTAVLAGIRREKWRGAVFGEDVIFSFAHPVHWGSEHDGIVLENFQSAVRGCFPESDEALLRFISEPEAAIHSLQRSALIPSDSSAKITLILDIGGSTTDLVASELGGEEPVFLARFGGPLGGDLYDAAIADHIAETLRIPPETLASDPAAGFTLRSVARRLKEVLSRQLLHHEELNLVPKRVVTLVSKDGQVFRGSIELDESRFQALTEHLHKRFQDLFNRALKGMSLQDDEIGRVVLVGGGSQLFSIVRSLRARYGPSSILVADNPGESVVQGASLEYGAALAKRRPTMIFMTGIEPAPEPQMEEAIPWGLITETGNDLPLKLGANRIGRSPANDVHLASEKISRWHAELSVTEQGCTLMDLGSTNGCFINDERLKARQAVPLHDGAQLRFGDRILTLQMTQGN